MRWNGMVGDALQDLSQIELRIEAAKFGAPSGHRSLQRVRPSSDRAKRSSSGPGRQRAGAAVSDFRDKVASAFSSQPCSSSIRGRERD
jgi:hypothetical protein